ncbi:transglutaminase family protein [Hyphomonas neptunium ATCC 15444]|uniref:Transglutaminase family protein n=2 Tax=Hyphomonas TaxID=85 RepID=Q0BY82_HYPNA|nr:MULTISPECIES: transglutaminase family protein [Hyphomonas]ABI78204.1 transglutaminase family protein [Hyphomonas neptunium ATCC 15444]KCZ88793.1 transglutaminase family protein [Hyphomonas hirschiana VP5]
MRVKIDASLAYNFAQPADVLLSLEAIRSDDQTIVSDRLAALPESGLKLAEGPERLGRRRWLEAEGDVTISYTALVDVSRRPLSIAGLLVPARRDLPYDVISYLLPSRYCEAEKLSSFAEEAFSGAVGGDLVLNMADWIFENFEYAPGSSNETTTATDTFLMRRGVCRDFAHTLISFCRAMGVPARMVSAYAPAIDPPDFHAVVEVWLDHAWHLIDPTRLSREEELVRIAIGRDATDISFMTIFGAAELRDQRVAVEVVAGNG